MHGFPNFWPGVLTLGGRPGTIAPYARRIALINDLFRHGDMIPSRLTPERFVEDQNVVIGLSEVFTEDPEYQRLRRGVNAMIAGWKSRSVLDRLHAFVRALEAVMRLEQGAGERQFAERVGVFASGTRIHDVSLEIYRLRSFEAHLSDWPSKLGYVRRCTRNLIHSKHRRP